MSVLPQFSTIRVRWRKTIRGNNAALRKRFERVFRHTPIKIALDSRHFNRHVFLETERRS
jgi:hypothetical protein